MKKQFLLLLLFLLSGCITVSTTDNIFTEALSTTLPSPPSHPYRDAIESSKNLAVDFEATEIHEQNYLKAMAHLKTGDFEKAETLLGEVLENANDTCLLNRADQLLSDLAVFQGKWKDVTSCEDNILVAKAYSTAPDEQWSFPPNPLTLPMEKSISGTPMIKVSVNGRQYNFWIDTGASMTVLSSNIAKECGVMRIESDEIALGTATNDISFFPGIIQKMEIGDIAIVNHPAIIIDQSQLTFKLFKIFTFLKIDGIIGENAIRKMHLKMDFKNDLISLSQPEKRDSIERNLIWITQPLAILHTSEGREVNFFFDSGANVTSLSTNFLTKQKLDPVKNKTAIKMGAGGKEKKQNTVFENLVLILDQYQLNFSSISCENEHLDKNEIIVRDGVLGCDIFEDKIIEIDYTNGRLDIQNE
ncbi:MAG: retroviral-like aspartic protease family protein [Candidatus Marinimicrobia bacterium]|nr:retroviral-like aspartic protease family protein [Candidatus Neomarinimicrobiota bacterium]